MTESVLDEHVFNEIAELMGDALGSFITTYLDNSPKLLTEMRNAIPTGDLQAVIHNAHQLKGGSGSIGAMQVFGFSKQLEEDARAGKAENLVSVFAQLEEAYGLLVEKLKVYL